MATSLPELELEDPGAWRGWLEAHHRTSAGVWLVFHKKHTRRRSIPYEDAVRGALAFGWIDSLVRRLDEDRYVRKFTPRRPGSVWSDLNRKRWAELKKAGRLAPSGLEAAPTRGKESPVPEIPKAPPPDFKAALEARPRAWQFFEELAPSHRRQYIGWIHLAKRPETRRKRIREAVALLSKRKKLGIV